MTALYVEDFRMESPLKREKFLWPLTQSHHRGLVLARRIKETLAKIKQGEADASLSKIAAETRSVFEMELRQHFADEEKMLDVFEADLGREDGDASKVRQDHELMRSLITDLNSHNLEVFAETLTQHIRFEENVLFGRVEEVFVDGEKTTFGRLFQEHSANLS